MVIAYPVIYQQTIHKVKAGPYIETKSAVRMRIYDDDNRQRRVLVHGRNESTWARVP